MQILFILLILCVVYSYVGYALLLLVVVKIKHLFRSSAKTEVSNVHQYPAVTLVIPAYNELEFIDKKMQNTFQLDYPKEKLRIVWVTDGSDDGSDEYLRKNYVSKYERYNIFVYHQPERKGKSAAINRIMEKVDTEIVIFCDANTFLNKESIKNIVRHFENAKIACVAGEKRVQRIDNTAGEGESFYWKYEALVKKLNSEFYTCIGAVGELMAFRKILFKPIPEDTILDDFVISMQMAEQSYKVIYEPDAYAEELPSADEKEEMKRKIRIAAGAFQCLFRYAKWLNFFKHPLLSFQYFSHKVTRWLLVPFSLPFILILNIILFFRYPDNLLYVTLLFAQMLIYCIALLQHFTNIPSRIFRIPYYVIIMNVAMCIGFWRYITGKQSAVWEKVRRKDG